MKAFGIFEGGGAQGLAHVGALEAAAQHGVEFIGVAGTSSGAIVAALTAAGYKWDRLYNPQSRRRGLLDVDFRRFLGTSEWKDWKDLGNDYTNTFAGVGLLRAWSKVPRFYWRNSRLLRKLSRDRGIFDTKAFEDWLNRQLTRKLSSKSHPVETAHFSDFKRLKKIPLKIVAAAVERQQRIKVFNVTDDPDVDVASAVAASICIPFFFKPKNIKGTDYVDGGIVSNFPAWVFDTERRARGPNIPTFGFRLVEERDESRQLSEQTIDRNLMDYCLTLFRIAVFGGQELEYRGIERLHPLLLRVNVKPLQFDRLDTEAEKDNLFYRGYYGASGKLKGELGPKPPARVKKFLTVFYEQMLAHLTSRALHLRVNIMMPTPTGNLRVMYSYNMDNDTDDRLEFPKGVGNAGKCWVKKDIMVADLTVARLKYSKKYEMDKYQQALVRPSLKSLLSVPIFRKADEWNADPANRKELIGVLNFDSDDDVITEFSSDACREFVIECANAAAKQLPVADDV